MKKIIALFVLTSFLAPTHVIANDGFAALGVGGITISKTDKIAIQKEVLDISCNTIHVSYDFINESDQDETALIMFPLPDYYATPPETYILAQGQPAEFSITVDGKPVTYETQVKVIDIEYAEANGNMEKIREHDVTQKMKSLGLTDKEIAAFPFNTEWVTDEKTGRSFHSYTNISEEKINKLKQAGFIQGTDDSALADWTNRVTYVWRQRFPARKIVHVEHTYQPLTSGGSVAGFYEDSDLKEYCVTEDQLTVLRRLYADEKNRDGYFGIPGLNVKYILTTANSWKDGIRDFTLKIHAKSKNEIVSACFPSKIRQVTETLYETNINNFHPSKELSVYLGNTRECNDFRRGVPPSFR